jgi:hypothetical protein
LRTEAEEGDAAVAAGDGPGHGAERAIDRALVAEALVQHGEFEHRAFVRAGEDRAGRQTVRPTGRGGARGRAGRAGSGGISLFAVLLIPDDLRMKVY